MQCSAVSATGIILNFQIQLVPRSIDLIGVGGRAIHGALEWNRACGKVNTLLGFVVINAAVGIERELIKM